MSALLPTSKAVDPARGRVEAPPIQQDLWRTIFEKHVSYVHHSLRRLGVREMDLQDLAHDVFVIAYRRYSSYDPERPLAAWLFGIAFRVASEYRRKPRFRKEVVDDHTEQYACPASHPEEALEAEQRRQLVLRALECIETDKRAIIVMHDIDGYAVPVIAETLEIPLNTAYSRLRLAREQFRKAVEQLRKNGVTREQA